MILLVGKRLRGTNHDGVARVLDYKSACFVLDVMEKLFGVEFDRSDLEEKCKQIEELANKVRTYEASKKKDNLGYIG